jgi:dihydroorotase
MKLLLKGGRVVDPATKTDGIADVLCEEGRISRVAHDIAPGDARVLALKGMVVAPGFVDMHCHLREPGQEWKETIESGTRAAAAGGFTAVACMPNTVPVNDERSVTEYIRARAKEKSSIRVYPIGAISKGLKGEELAEIGDLVAGGAVAVSDDGRPVVSGTLFRKALEYASMFGIPVIDHCEDLDLSDGGVLNEGIVSTVLGLKGWNHTAEEVMVFRDLTLARETGARVHIAHASTAGSVALVRDARARGAKATLEVTPHHFSLTEEACRDFDTHAKMNPPLRTEADRRAILEGIADGTVDAIATDHAPHHADEKSVEFARAPFGIVGLETAVSLALDRLVEGGVIGLARLVDLFSVGPSRILGLPGGTLAPGAPADITVLDPARRVVVDASRFRSKARNTPFDGWTLKGGPVATIVGGMVVHDVLTSTA